MPLVNTWINYVQRSYLTAKESFVASFPTVLPELTDFNSTDLFIRLTEMWSGLLEQLGYYLDNHARESHSSVARLWLSMRKHADIADYRLHSYVAANVEVRFSISAVHVAGITIPAGTIVSTAEGVEFRTLEDGVIAAGQTAVTVPSKQGELVSAISLGTSNGAANQTFEINDNNVADSSVVVRVAGLTWTPKETLGWSLQNDQHYVQTLSANRNVMLVFGNGFNGKIPVNASSISVDYLITEGENGNVGAGTINTVVSAVTMPSGITLSVSNLLPASNGAGLETVDALRRKLPSSLRTLLRAVTQKDHEDIAEQFPGVASARMNFVCGNPGEMYILPENGGLASQTLLDDVEEWMNEFRLTGRKLNYFPAGEVDLLLNITMRVLPQYDRAATVALAKTNLVAFAAPGNLPIKGFVQLSDLYQTIETTNGVQHSTITGMTAVPYARAKNTDTPLVWTRATKPDNNAVVKFWLKFVTDSTFQVFRNQSYIGTGEVGTLFDCAQVSFTVTGVDYIAGDFYEFYCYPYFGTLELVEFSVPRIDAANITITATGGV